jgi:outer membrane protein assembly factor BamB
MFGDEPGGAWSSYYVGTARGIRVFDPSSGRELWTQPATARSEAELLVARSDVAVFATLYEIFALNVATGERRWSHGEYPPHLDDEGADFEAGGAFRAHALQGDRLVSVRDNGEMSCVSIATGRLLWSEARRPAALGRLRIVEPWVVYHVVQDGKAVLCVIDAANGAWLDAIVTEEKRSVEELFVTLDGQIIVVTSQSIASYDLETRSRRWLVMLQGAVRRASLILDLDALYLSDNGFDLRKLDLEDGRSLWQSERLVERGEEDLTVQQQDQSLIVSTASSVSAVDAGTGLTLWRGTTSDRPRLAGRLLSDAYVVAVDLGAELRDGPSVAYFYDHRNGSGVIPRDGGARDLGRLTEVRAVLVSDGALLVQAGSAIHAWAQK